MPNNLENQAGLEETQSEETGLESNTVEGDAGNDTNDTNTTQTPESNDGKSQMSERAKERALRREKEKSEAKDYQKMYENMMKERQNERSLYDRQMNEIRAQQAEFAKHQKLLQEIADLKKKSEMEQLKQTNPDEYQKRMMQDAFDERLKSLQQNQQAQFNPQGQAVNDFTPEQFVQMGNQATQVLKQDPAIGEEKYQRMEPMMLSILRNVEKSDAAKLLQNPRALFNMAVGEAYMIQLQQNEQKTIQGTQKANSFHEGTAKPVSGGKKAQDFSQMSDKELTALKNAEILKEYNLGR